MANDASTTLKKKRAGNENKTTTSLQLQTCQQSMSNKTERYEKAVNGCVPVFLFCLFAGSVFSASLSEPLMRFVAPVFCFVFCFAVVVLCHTYTQKWDTKGFVQESKQDERR